MGRPPAPAQETACLASDYPNKWIIFIRGMAKQEENFIDHTSLAAPNQQTACFSPAPLCLTTLEWI